MNTKLTFGEWLGDELHRRGWSQAELAEYLRMSESTVSSWKGTSKPRRTTCRRIAEALGMDENEILVRAGHAPRDLHYELPELRGGEQGVRDGGIGYHTLARRSGNVRSPNRARQLLDQRLADLEEEIAEIRRLLREEE